MGSYGALAEAGKYDVGPVSSYICYEGAFFIIQYAIVGIVIGLIHGKKFRSNWPHILTLTPPQEHVETSDHAKKRGGTQKPYE